MFLNIKYAYYGLIKRSKSSLLAIIQLSICLAFFYFIIKSNTNIGNEVERITSIFKGRYIYAVSVHDDQSILNNSDKLKNSEAFCKYLKESSRLTHVTYTCSNINLQNFNGVNKFISPGGRGESYSWVRSIDVSENFMKNFAFEIEQGRNFSDNDFRKDIKDAIPVILGPDYKNFFNINDEIKYNNMYGGGIRKLKVIGFLKKNYYFLSNSELNPRFDTINLDSYVIFPIQPIENTMSLKEYDKGYSYMKNVLEFRNLLNSLIIINTNSKTEKDKIIYEINNEVKKLNLQTDITIEDLTNKSDTLINRFNNSVRESESVAYMTILFTSIGIICTSLNSIKKRYEEFGVHIAYGCTIKDISIRIFHEIFMITTASLILACFFIVIINKKFRLPNEAIISWICLIKLILFSIMLSLIISILPILKILKSKPTDLIKR